MGTPNISRMGEMASRIGAEGALVAVEVKAERAKMHNSGKTPCDRPKLREIPFPNGN